MDTESFHDLSLRVIAGEATDEEGRALEAELASTPARRGEFEELKLTHEILRTTAPMAQATQALTPGLPAYRVGELRTAVRQHFGPAAKREKAQMTPGVLIQRTLRWIFAGISVGALASAVVISCLANKVVEVGLYKSDLARSGDQGLSASDVPSARLVTFDQDTPFDQWQSTPLAWNEHAKIWIDNEHDLLYVMRRVRHGQIVTHPEPLAATEEGQREQIKQAVAELDK